MKYFTIILMLVLASCNKTTTQPIVDYSTNYAENERMLSFSKELKRQNKQTLVLINQKESDLKSLTDLIQRDKINNVKVIKDSSEIKRLNYSYNTIKTIIFATKK
ncbi:hypothetical protein PFY10_10230 [Chryseobacterium daecheongense]|nr:hypothetical protein PFY10_10230 [Chryseobacterium daecheongense]